MSTPSGNCSFTSSGIKALGITLPLFKKDLPKSCAVIPPSSFASAVTNVSKTKSPRSSSSLNISAFIN